MAGSMVVNTAMLTNMKRFRSLRARVLMATALALTLVAAAVAAIQAGTVLTMHGKTLSSGVKLIVGHAYVPLVDVAKAFGGKAVQTAGGYEIQTEGPSDDTSGGAAGGGTAVKGTKGAIGQMVMTGKWSFEVVEVTRSASAESQYSPEHQTFMPSGPNEELVIIHCKLKNASKVALKPMLSVVHPHNIALADDQGQSHPLMAFDKRVANPDEGPNMLPGSLTDFNAIFSVPKDTKLKDLVFSLQVAYDDYPDGGVDVRISLKS